jgi:hypothetical protein
MEEKIKLEDKHIANDPEWGITAVTGVTTLQYC